MPIAFLADIHANVHALNAVLEDIATTDADRLVCLGDTVGYGPHPGECVDLLRRLKCLAVMGNHDFYVSSDSPGIAQILTDPAVATNPVWAGVKHARQQLDAGQLAWLRDRPPVLSVEDAIVAHAALHDFENWPYLRTPEDAQPTLELLEERIGFFGHTHRENVFTNPAGPQPEILEEESILLPADTPVAITAGSVGRSRDSDPRARWLSWNPAERTIRFHRVPYDHDATLAASRDAGLPV